ncbi:hypothetical protein BpHYR1_020889 [Brachionus plicatilis]|uniref:Uncharacterized protein n=1 Tax=Brachionus plicatilis TaxID=10195 RepID=A0A3M7RW15_BRAPC|nr:hypothetical protein BpHYR1_020889 [Brachionus plicatilis]
MDIKVPRLNKRAKVRPPKLERAVYVFSWGKVFDLWLTVFCLWGQGTPLVIHTRGPILLSSIAKI